jgi:hypothetical protein
MTELHIYIGDQLHAIAISSQIRRLHYPLDTSWMVARAVLDVMAKREIPASTRNYRNLSMSLYQ